MGYTHYFRLKRPSFTVAEWGDVIAGMHFLYEHAHENDIKLVDADGETGVPMATADAVSFNGLGFFQNDGSENDGHGYEGFEITRKRDPEAWGFCKTGRAPYDIIITALLAYLDSVHPEKWVTTSDGRTKDWEAGVALARKAWPAKANQIQVPRAVRDTDRYSHYHDSSKLYQVATDHGGQLWIERHKDRARIRLDQDWYEEVMNKLPHGERKYGSFGPGDSTRCATKRLARIWLNREICDCPVEMPDTFAPLAA